MNQDTHLKLTNRVSVIGSVTDFTYKWGLNAGLTDDEALRLALAVDELVTDVVLFAFGDEEGAFDLIYRWTPSDVEVIVRELGEPFDPERHTYDPERALREGNFEGAGLELIRHLVDDFVFLNKGRQGKEFRLIKRTTAEHIAEAVPYEAINKPVEPAPETTYTIRPVTRDDAETIAKLIYRTYGYTYNKEELYFPKKIEMALERGEKFGVLAQTAEGEPVGYFAVLRTTDSRIGEVGEAVVSPPHRRRGLMKRMLARLVEMAKERNLLGLFGEAVTVHTISQRTNLRLGFQSTALLLNAFPTAKYRGLVEKYPQDVSVVIDFLPLKPAPSVRRYLPPAYLSVLTDLYASLGTKVHSAPVRTLRSSETARTDDRFNLEYRHAVIVVEQFGKDLAERVRHTVETLRHKGIRTFFIDLPLDDPGTIPATEMLRREGFYFCGLMPLFHRERDYLRLQRTFRRFRFDRIEVFSEQARRIKRFIEEEMSCGTT
ncbi:MAG: hypothetical protein KatS3mg042_0082 [Rhodothermaceae bacterium]|nr:MAG: hypothetical protein KatS3mg042_0082 [Rhodothermaceae bacterium]